MRLCIATWVTLCVLNIGCDSDPNSPYTAERTLRDGLPPDGDPLGQRPDATIPIVQDMNTSAPDVGMPADNVVKSGSVGPDLTDMVTSYRSLQDNSGRW